MQYSLVYNSSGSSLWSVSDILWLLWPSRGGAPGRVGRGQFRPVRGGRESRVWPQSVVRPGVLCRVLFPTGAGLGSTMFGGAARGPGRRRGKRGRGIRADVCSPGSFGVIGRREWATRDWRWKRRRSVSDGENLLTGVRQVLYRFVWGGGGKGRGNNKGTRGEARGGRGEAHLFGFLAGKEKDEEGTQQWAIARQRQRRLDVGLGGWWCGCLAPRKWGGMLWSWAGEKMRAAACLMSCLVQGCALKR